MGRTVTFSIEINNQGEAIIKFPESGPGKVDASDAAALTRKLAEMLGPIKERHVGHEHAHDHSHRHDHLTH